MKLVLKNKKVAIIAGVSAAVLVTALGVGLGVGLDNSSSSDENPGYVANANHYVAYNGIGVTAEDIRNGKALIDGEEFLITKQNEDFYLKIPSVSGVSYPSVEIYKLFDIGVDRIYSNEEPTVGRGKDGYYDIDYASSDLAIGVVRIPHDGKIYGGFIESTKENVDYEIDPKLKKLFPNGYEIGDFKYELFGGINMLKLEKLKTLLKYNGSLDTMADVETALENVPTTTRFGFFLDSQSSIKIATYKKATTPSELGYVPENFDNPITLSTDDYLLSSNTVTMEQHAQGDIVFSISGFKDSGGHTPTITLKQGTGPLSAETKEVSLDNLYTFMSFVPDKTKKHPVFGNINFGINGVLRLDDSVKTVSGEQPVIHQNPDSTYTIPTLLLRLDATNFNETAYATAATRRENNELLINVESDWLDYFQKTANDQRVKDLAKEMGITIRFKVSDIKSETHNISANSFNASTSEVFFVNNDLIDEVTNHDIKEIRFAPLLENGILQTNLENSTYFDDSWKNNAKFFTGTLMDKYGAYPFSRQTQIIAYNSDYLSNGLDFANQQTVASYLYQDDLGGLGTVKTTKAADTVTDEQKNGLLVNFDLKTGGTVWAFDYYPNTKKDQRPGQQDVAWRKAITGDSTQIDPSTLVDYWSVFADPNLKDDERFQKWADHITNSHADRVGSLNKDESYDIYALFNGHIGAIMIDSSWITDEWKSGEWRTDGTTQEKSAFAHDKIKFQTIPTGLEKGQFGAIASTLKKDKGKQQVAEMFLNILSDPNKGSEFYEATAMLPARKDVTSTVDSYEATSHLFTAVTNTHTVYGVKTYEQWPFNDIFKFATASIFTYANAHSKSESDYYEGIANLYKDAATNRPTDNVRNVFAPEVPDADAS